MSFFRLWRSAALAAAILITPLAFGQQTWQATAGSQSKDMALQALAFLPNEMWIHAGDSITWTSQSGDIHTISFLITAQPFPPFAVGCPNFSPSGVSFTGVNCVSSPTLNQGQSFTVKFPVTGNFSLLCLVHPHMTGTIHVLPTSATLPHDQAYYNQQAALQSSRLLSDSDGWATGHEGHDANGNDSMANMMRTRVLVGSKGVVAGTGEVNATAGGLQSLAVMRFFNGTIRVHAGDTVEWSVLDPVTPHTVTLGMEQGNPTAPSGNVTVDADGARHVTLHYVGESANSGLLGQAPMNIIGVPQQGVGVTVFRVTFTQAGTYDYICALHDTLGMVGKVIVEP